MNNLLISLYIVALFIVCVYIMAELNKKTERFEEKRPWKPPVEKFKPSKEERALQE